VLVVAGTRSARAPSRAGLAASVTTGARGRRAWLAGWLALCVVGSFNYYQFDRRVLTTVGDYADATYYYLNSKYFAELGYTRLYHAMLVADQEGPRRLRKVPVYRDLAGYERLIPRREAFVTADALKARFTPERWRGFSGDLAFITQQDAAGGWDYFFIDHGYNPPPTWTLLGESLARLAPVDALKRITSLDMLLVALMFVGVARGFGLHALLVSLAFYLCTFSGRWPILGQSILRFDWLAALVLAAVCLKRGRHGWAGACLAYAAQIRVFPAVFFVPYGLHVLRELWRTRRLAPGQLRFALGAALCVLLLGGGSLVRYGADGWRDAIDKVALHSSPESYSSHRVGLGAALMYRGEWSGKDLARHGGIDAKRAELWQLDHYLELAGAASLLLVAFVAWRSQEPVHRLLWLGMLPLFCLTNPQINYYNLRLLPVLWHAERLDERWHRLSLASLFLVEAIAQLVHVLGAARYAVTCLSSWGLLAYLLAQAVHALRQARRPVLPEIAPDFAAKSSPT
jgi:hypothetical protein